MEREIVQSAFVRFWLGVWTLGWLAVLKRVNYRKWKIENSKIQLGHIVRKLHVKVEYMRKLYVKKADNLEELESEYKSLTDELRGVRDSSQAKKENFEEICYRSSKLSRKLQEARRIAQGLQHKRNDIRIIRDVYLVNTQRTLDAYVDILNRAETSDLANDLNTVYEEIRGVRVQSLVDSINQKVEKALESFDDIDQRLDDYKRELEAPFNEYSVKSTLDKPAKDSVIEDIFADNREVGYTPAYAERKEVVVTKPRKERVMNMV
jgi:DNA repair exonuclease SbcCD ATPase subunit